MYKRFTLSFFCSFLILASFFLVRLFLEEGSALQLFPGRRADFDAPQCRTHVEKQIHFLSGGKWQNLHLTCESAVLKKVGESWFERWEGVQGEWSDGKVNREFNAKEAFFSLSDYSFGANQILFQDEDKRGKIGEFSLEWLENSPLRSPICEFKGVSVDLEKGSFP